LSSPPGTLTDSINVTVTANGYFSPGRLFKTASAIYSVNRLNANEAIVFDSSLNITGEVQFNNAVKDGGYIPGTLQLLFETSVTRYNDSFSDALTWGNFGEGPGRVLNGKYITCYGDSVYIYDGTLLKEFGK